MAYRAIHTPTCALSPISSPTLLLSAHSTPGFWLDTGLLRASLKLVTYESLRGIIKMYILESYPRKNITNDSGFSFSFSFLSLSPSIFSC